MSTKTTRNRTSGHNGITAGIIIRRAEISLDGVIRPMKVILTCRLGWYDTYFADLVEIEGLPRWVENRGESVHYVCAGPRLAREERIWERDITPSGK